MICEHLGKKKAETIKSQCGLKTITTKLIFICFADRFYVSPGFGK